MICTSVRPAQRLSLCRPRRYEIAATQKFSGETQQRVAGRTDETESAAKARKSRPPGDCRNQDARHAECFIEPKVVACAARVGHGDGKMCQSSGIISGQGSIPVAPVRWRAGSVAWLGRGSSSQGPCPREIQKQRPHSPPPKGRASSPRQTKGEARSILREDRRGGRDRVHKVADGKTDGHGEGRAIDHSPNLQPGALGLLSRPDQGHANAEHSEDKRQVERHEAERHGRAGKPRDHACTAWVSCQHVAMDRVSWLPAFMMTVAVEAPVYGLALRRVFGGLPALALALALNLLTHPSRGRCSCYKPGHFRACFLRSKPASPLSKRSR